MANFRLETTNTGRGAPNSSIDFISWSPYPQGTNKKTELINRIGSTETLIQTLYESSTPTRGVAISFLYNSNITAILALQATMNSTVGVECKLTDSINNATYNKLVITDLTNRIKKVNVSDWMLICEFTQMIRVK